MRSSLEALADRNVEPLIGTVGASDREENRTDDRVGGCHESDGAMKVAFCLPCVADFAKDAGIQTASHFGRQFPDACVSSDACEREALTANLPCRETTQTEQTSERKSVVSRNCAAEVRSA